MTLPTEKNEIARHDWSAPVPRAELRALAERAARRIIRRPPPPGQVIPKPWLFAFVEFPSLPASPREEQRNRYDVACLEFISEWRERVLGELGRWPKTISGRGFDLLSPEETMNIAVTGGYATALRAMGRSAHVLSSVREEDLTPTQRQVRSDEQVRMGRYQQLLSEEQARASILCPMPLRSLVDDRMQEEWTEDEGNTSSGEGDKP